MVAVRNRSSICRVAWRKLLGQCADLPRSDVKSTSVSVETLASAQIRAGAWRRRRSAKEVRTLAGFPLDAGLAHGARSPTSPNSTPTLNCEIEDSADSNRPAPTDNQRTASSQITHEAKPRPCLTNLSGTRAHAPTAKEQELAVSAPTRLVWSASTASTFAVSASARRPQTSDSQSTDKCMFGGLGWSLTLMGHERNGLPEDERKCGIPGTAFYEMLTAITGRLDEEQALARHLQLRI